MVFGDVRSFAIEAEVEQDLVAPSAIWGRMCVSCQGVPLGDIHETFCGLSHAATEFEWISNHLEELWDESLAGLDDIAAFTLLDAAIYGDDGRTDEQVRADAERYGKFIFLTNWGEQFNGCKAFLNCPPDGSVRILYQLANSLIGGCTVEGAEFVDSATAFIGWFREQSKRLRGLDASLAE